MNIFMRLSGMMLALLAVGSAWGMVGSLGLEKQVIVLNAYNEPVEVAPVQKGYLKDTFADGYPMAVQARRVIALTINDSQFNQIKWKKLNSWTSKYFPLAQENYLIIRVHSGVQEKSFKEKLLVGAKAGVDFEVIVSSMEKPEGWDELFSFAQKIYALSADMSMSDGMLSDMRRFDEGVGALINDKDFSFFYSKEKELKPRRVFVDEMFAVVSLRDFSRMLEQWQKDKVTTAALDKMWQDHKPEEGKYYKAYYKTKAQEPGADVVGYKAKHDAITKSLLFNQYKNESK